MISLYLEDKENFERYMEQMALHISPRCPILRASKLVPAHTITEAPPNVPFTLGEMSQETWKRYEMVISGSSDPWPSNGCFPSP